MKAFDFAGTMQSITEMNKLSYRAGFEAGFKTGMQEGSKKMRYYVEQVPDPYEPADSGMQISKVLEWNGLGEPEVAGHRCIAGPFATREEASRTRSDD